MVTGAGFGTADTVSFVPSGGGAPIPDDYVSVVSDTEIVLETPDVSSDMSGPGALQTNVQVTAPDGNVSTIGPSGEFNFPLTIVEIGDSVAAGEGTLYGYDYDSTTGLWTGVDSSPTWAGSYQACHQAPYAYGQVVSSALGANFVNLACTGASYYNGIRLPEGTTTATSPPLPNTRAPPTMPPSRTQT